MRRRESAGPVAMTRLAVVAPCRALRDTLVLVADSGVVEFDRATAIGDAATTEPVRRLRRLAAAVVEPRLSATEPDLDMCERDGRIDLLTGEAQLAGYAAEAVVRGDVAALIGWAPTARVPALATRLAAVGGAAAPLATPRGVEPPTAIRTGATRESFAPLVRTYTTVPYPDVDPTIMAGLAYVVMFGAMFGDVGHGALLLFGALALRVGRPGWLAKLHSYWRFVAGAGLFSVVFGLLYGECFGPTGLVPTIWLSPMDHPVPLLFAGVGLGTVLLAGAYTLGTVNRVREGGWSLALYAPSGLAGSALFLAAGVGVLAWYLNASWLGVVAVALALAGLGLAFTGLLVGAGGGASGVTQAVIELFDTVLRIGSNVVSFARLAAFGLTHAVLGWIVWTATAGLWQRGSVWVLAAIVVFMIGNAVTFSLEALVAGVQALRLEYYELFSRVFLREGRPFRPWHVPTDPESNSVPPPPESGDPTSHAGSIQEVSCSRG